MMLFATGTVRPTHARQEKLDGVTYEIFPVVACVAGVLNDGLITAEELERSAPSWAGRIVTLSHPVDESGEPISANSPDAWAEWGIGYLFNTRVADGKLMGEMWLHPAKTPRDVIRALRSGRVTDVSIGYFCDQSSEDGLYNGKAYKARHTALRPDHLALLVGEEGACSVEDGCGVPRTHSIQRLASQLITAVRTACKCTQSHEEGYSMHKSNDVLAALRKLRVAEKLTAKQIEMLQNFDEEQLAMVRALVEMLLENSAQSAEPEMPVEEPESLMDEPEDAERDEDAPSTLAKLVREAVAAELEVQSKRREAIASIDLHSAGLTRDDVQALPIETLQRLAARHPSRRADFSVFAGHVEKSSDYRPMTLPAGVLARTSQ